MKPTEAIRIGDLVAARDELTGRNVWRKVTETYNRQAPDILSVSMEAGHGKVTIVSVTSEHPFHVQDWDGKVETMVAALNDVPSLDAARLFPSDGKTPTGEWVKAGALKVGDQVSAHDSVEPAAANDNGPRMAANDNQPLTITEIIRDNAPTRVYNFEVESRSGEITHNYFVGDDAAWVHNAGKAHPFLTLYKKLDPNGNFLKWGVTWHENPNDRYTRKELNGGSCEVFKTGPRNQMLLLERFLVRLRPGIQNLERWAGRGIP